ncbi:FAD/NAD(P)-binding protein [Vibrio ostreicida]|uniref:FAD/NAD(P)-binding protein n=1 Tax=Vibrio ostreicida TaxID=526588 RepID=UPI0009711628|nr:FAD/NAD(P)-binding protein [Vibrio ostreicida]
MNTLGIVGGGAGCIATLNQITQHDHTIQTIYLFSEDHEQVGYAYKAAPDIFIMNTRLDSLTQFNDVLPINQWLDNKNKHYEDDDYIPRDLYGKYLQSVKERILDTLYQQGVNCEELPRADYINSNGNVISNDREYCVDASVISIGFGSDLLNESLFEKIKNCDSSQPITLYGSGLSSIDIILFAHKTNPNFKLNCRSLSGRFPRVRSQFKSDGDSIFDGLQDSEITYEGVLNRFHHCLNNETEKGIVYDPNFSLTDEIQYCESTLPEWQRKLYNGTSNYLQVYQQLSHQDKRRFFEKRSSFIETRAMFPLKNAKKLATLINDKQLTIEKGAYDPQSSKSHEVLGFNQSSRLDFVEKSRLPRHSIFGVDVDHTCQVKDHRSIFCLGPLTNGSRYFTEATSLTVRDAEVIVQSLTNKQERRTYA